MSNNLWSDCPRERLIAARSLTAQQTHDLQKRATATSPMQPWPYGMPTTINPYLLVVGPSPGNSPHQGDTVFLQRPAYAAPTVGLAHPAFSYQDASGYWDKIRQLSVGLIQGFDPELPEDECYALSGQLNLGVGAFGNASESSIELVYARWVPKIMMDMLQPRIVVLFGLWSLMKNNTILQQDFAGALGIDWKKPDKELPFKGYREKRLVFREWRIKRPDGRETIVVSWPNHPSRSPMTNANLWQASIREAILYFR